MAEHTRTERWAFATARWRFVILALAALFAIVAGTLGGPVIEDLRTGPSTFDAPNSQSVRVQDLVRHATGIDPRTSLIALVSVPAGPRSVDSQARIRRVSALLRRDPEVGRTVSIQNARDPDLLARDGRLAMVVAGFRSQSEQAASAAVERITRATAGIPWVRVGGPALVDHEIDDSVTRDIFRAEALALPLLFLSLCFVFRGLVAAALPIVLGLFAVLGALLGLRLGASIAPLSAFALNLVTGLGLGLAIDYSLLIVSRYRDERATGLEPRDALARTLATAGRTVAFSALTVSGALAVLLTFPQPFVYSMGVGGVSVSLLAGVLALGVLPALLMCLDPWLGRLQIARARDPQRPERRWRALALSATRRPAATVLLSLTLLLVFAAPLRYATFTFGDVRVLPADSPARVAADVQRARFQRGSDQPIQVVLSDQHDSVPSDVEVEKVARSLTRFDGVLAVRGPVALSRSSTLLTVLPAWRGKDPRTLKLVDSARAVKTPLDIAVGGDAAALVDLHEELRAHLSFALLLVAVWLLVAIQLLTRSLALALATLAMSTLSLAASLGLLVIAFQDGWLAKPLDFVAEGAIGSAEPIVLLFLVLALTSDYATFLLARIHEAHQAGAGVREAVVIGVAKTGSVVSSAALLFAIALGAFMTSSNVYVKQLGFGAMAAVLLDATVVRAMLLPATIVLLDRRAWWTPRILAGKRRPLNTAARVTKEEGR